MPNTKLHPSIIIYTRNRFGDNEPRYYLGNRQVSADDVAQVSAELWEVTLTTDSKPQRKLRDEPWEW